MPLRILIVDDDKHTCRILTSLLRHDPLLGEKGVQVLVAGDGEKGLQALAEGPVDLVISDLLMPRMDGFAFCRELRQRPGCEQVPLIVNSAVYKDPITVRKLRVEVGAEFFTKPFQVSEMMQTVRSALGLIAAADAGKASTTSPVPKAGDEGSLAERPLPQLLLDVFEARTSACLHLQRGERRLRVHLFLGHIIAVDSNSRADALGNFMLSKGVLSEQQLCEALAQSVSTRRRLGQVLVEQGLVSEAQLLLQMEAQMQQRLKPIMRWQSGRWRLDTAGPPYERITLSGGTPVLVFSALRDTALPDRLGEQHGNVTARLHGTPRAARLREPFERVFGPHTLAVLDDEPVLSTLLDGQRQCARDALITRIDAMLLCGLCTLERTGRARAPRKEHPPPAPVVSDELYPSTPPVPARELHPRHSQLLAEYLAVDGRDLYELLGVGREAPLREIHAAYQAIMERLSPERFSDLDLGPDHGKISELRERYRNALMILSSPMRRAAYDEMLDQAKPELSPRMVQAELSYRRAQAAIDNGNLDEAPPLLEQALALCGDQADYHALLGWARFLLMRHQEMGPEAAALVAQPHLLRALEIDEDHVTAHARLGHIAAALGNYEQSISYFERALDLDPLRRDALSGLERALGDSGQWQRLERVYRRLLRRLSVPSAVQEPEAINDLWRRLAILLEEQLLDPQAAGLAVEALIGRVPDDASLRAWWSRLRRDRGDEWQEEAERLQREWLRDGQAQSGLKLHRLRAQLAEVDPGRHLDAAYLCAAVLCRRGQAEKDAREDFLRHRPRFLSRLQGPITQEIIALIRHPDDPPALEVLLARLSALSRTMFPEEDLSLPEERRVLAETMPQDLARVESYVPQVLSARWPSLWTGPAAAGGRAVPVLFLPPGRAAHLFCSPAPAALLSPELIESRDRTELAFLFGRLAGLCSPGRMQGLRLSAAELRRLVLGVASTLRPAYSFPDPDGELAAARELLQPYRLMLHRDAGSLLDEVLPTLTGLDFRRWQEGMSRSADRLGLLLCNDVETAARCAKGHPNDEQAEADLLEFVLSDAYLHARDALGLSVQV